MQEISILAIWIIVADDYLYQKILPNFIFSLHFKYSRQIVAQAYIFSSWKSMWQLSNKVIQSFEQKSRSWAMEGLWSTE